MMSRFKLGETSWLVTGGAHLSTTDIKLQLASQATYIATQLEHFYLLVCVPNVLCTVHDSAEIRYAAPYSSLWYQLVISKPCVNLLMPRISW